MTVYLVSSYDVVDPDGFQQYVGAVQPLLQKHGGQILAAEVGAEPLEGQARAVNVVLRFPSRQSLHAWYNDKDYARAKAIRLRSTTNTSIVPLSEFVPPSA